MYEPGDCLIMSKLASFAGCFLLKCKLSVELTCMRQLSSWSLHADNQHTLSSVNLCCTRLYLGFRGLKLILAIHHSKIMCQALLGTHHLISLVLHKVMPSKLGRTWNRTKQDWPLACMANQLKPIVYPSQSKPDLNHVEYGTADFSILFSGLLFSGLFRHCTFTWYPADSCNQRALWMITDGTSGHMCSSVPLVNLLRLFFSSKSHRWHIIQAAHSEA